MPTSWTCFARICPKQTSQCPALSSEYVLWRYRFFRPCALCTLGLILLSFHVANLMWPHFLHVCLGLWASHGLSLWPPHGVVSPVLCPKEQSGGDVTAFPPLASFLSLLFSCYFLMAWVPYNSSLDTHLNHFRGFWTIYFKYNMAYLLHPFIFKKNLSLIFFSSQTIALKRKIPLNSRCVAPGGVTSKKIIFSIFLSSRATLDLLKWCGKQTSPNYLWKLVMAVLKQYWFFHMSKQS